MKNTLYKYGYLIKYGVNLFISRFALNLYKNKSAISTTEKIAHEFAVFCHTSNIHINASTLTPKKRVKNFLSEVLEGLKSVNNRGNANSSQIILADSASSAWPELKGVTPRGWPKTSTWDDAEGFGLKNGIAIFNIPSKRSLSAIVRHEYGHFVDLERQITTTNSYRKAYRKDLLKFDENCKKHLIEPAALDYFVQGSNSSRTTLCGRQESFAELFACSHGGGNGFDEILPKLFPNTLAYVKKVCSS